MKPNIFQSIFKPLFYKITDVFKRKNDNAFDPLIDAYLAKCTTEGYTAASGAVLTALNQLILDLVSAGIINAVGDRGVKVSNYLDFIHVLATSSSSDSNAITLNLLDVENIQGTKVSAPTYGDGGLSGDGVAAHYLTGYNPFTDGVNYQLNDSSIGCFVNRLSTVTGAYMGCIRSSFTQISNVVPNYLYRINQGTGVTNRTLATGFTTVSRISNTQIRHTLDGSGVNSNQGVVSIPNEPLVALAAGLSGSIVGFTDGELSVIYGGADITPVEAEFSTAINTYLTSIGL